MLRPRALASTRTTTRTACPALTCQITSRPSAGNAASRGTITPRTVPALIVARTMAPISAGALPSPTVASTSPVRALTSPDTMSIRP